MALFGIREDPAPTAYKPHEFNKKRCKGQILKRVEASRRPAGSPILSFSIEHSNRITEDSACSKPEIQRRRELDATYVYLRLFCDDKEVTRTVARPLNHATFKMQFSGIDDLAEASNVVKAPSRYQGSPSSQSKSSFAVKMASTPKSIRVEIYEAGVFGDIFLGEVFVPVPKPPDHSNALDREIKVLQFTGRPFVAQPHASASAQAAQAAKKIVKSDLDHTSQWVSGQLRMNVSWASSAQSPKVSSQARSIVAATKTLDPISSHGPPGRLNLPKLMEWVADMQLDPNDPRNSHILKLKMLLSSVSNEQDLTTNSIQEYWRSRSVLRLGLPRWLQQTMFGTCETTELIKLKRLQLLSARHRKAIAITVPVPLYESDIDPNLLEPIQKAEYNDQAEPGQGSSWNIHHGSSTAISKPPADKRITVGFLKRVREIQLVRRAQLAKPISVDDFVREERMAPPPEQENPLEFLFRTKRPLNPARVDRQHVVTASPESCRIVVQILRGFNLPVRKFALRQFVDPTSNKQPTTPIYVAPFVEVCFQQRKVRTTTADGQHPQWNETISLDVQAPNDDFSPEALNQTDLCTEMLFVNLFDEIVIDLLQDERERATSIHQRKERSWLGTLQIPFSTIWSQIRIDGHFKMRLPPQSLGYEKKALENSLVPFELPTSDTLLHLFITLDPLLSQPSPLTLKFQSDEDPRLLRFAKQWISQIAGFKRVVLATTLDLKGKTRFICRFIRPQEPPPRLTTVQHLLRFVSMIPNIPNRIAFDCDCTLTSVVQEILQVGAADAMEHAILLCNFLLARGHCAFVALGKGIPDGTAAYVLVKPAVDMAVAVGNATTEPSVLMEAGQANVLAQAKAPAVTQDPSLKKTGSAKELAGTEVAASRTISVLAPGWTLYNPITGEENDLTDVHLPLKEIGCVFNNENIWANIQPSSVPRCMHFKFEDPASWKAFFGPQFAAPADISRSVQSAYVHFQDPVPAALLEMEAAIEAAVVSRMEEWRQGRVTRWNRRTFKVLMARFESDIVAGVSIGATLETSSELQTIGNVYKLNGFPLNTPFIDIASICSMVHNTAVFANYSPGVEFALAVQCYGYPGRFVSVWIYVASLVRNT
eukprot:jgi/Hompol1/5026/HPOL_000561-RA